MLVKPTYKMKPPLSAKINPGHSLSDKLVACYLFSEGSGLTAFDSSSRRHPGTLSGAVTRTMGKFGRAIEYDGTDGEVVVSAAPDLDMYGKTAYSISSVIYCKSGGGGTYGRIVDKGGAVDGYYFHVSDETATTVDLVFIMQMSGISINVRKRETLKLNQWARVTATYNEGGTKHGKLYINSTLQSLEIDVSGTGTPRDDSGDDMYIGTNLSGNRGFDGVISSTMIWGRALTGSDVIRLNVNPFCMFARSSRLLVTI